MTNINNGRLWENQLNQGKNVFGEGATRQACQLFHRSELTAAELGASDVRRGISYSWLAICYFELGNYDISESMFRLAEDIMTLTARGLLRQEIELNLALLGQLSISNGKLRAAQPYYENLTHDVHYLAKTLERDVSVSAECRPTRAARQSSLEKQEEIRQLRDRMNAAVQPKPARMAAATAEHLKNLWLSTLRTTS